MADVLITTNDFGTRTDADNVRIPHTNTNNVTVTMDNASKLLAELVIAQGFEKALGAAGDPLRCNVTSLKMFGSGGFWFKADDDVGSEVTTDVLIKCGRPDTPFQLDSSASSGGTYQNTRIIRGKGEIASSLKWAAGARLDVAGVVPGDVTLALTATAALPTLVAQQCSILSQTPLTAAILGAGATLRQTTGVVADINILAAGRFELNHTAATLVVVQPGGTLDLTQTEAFKTITTLYLSPGAILLANGEPNQAGGPTVTNLIDLRND